MTTNTEIIIKLKKGTTPEQAEKILKAMCNSLSAGELHSVDSASISKTIVDFGV